MGIDDLVNKGKQLFEENREKIDQALHSEQAETISDKALDGVAGFAKKLLPDEHDAKIDEVRNTVDKSIGNE